MAKKASKAKSKTIHHKLDTHVNSLTGYAILFVLLVVGMIILSTAS